MTRMETFRTRRLGAGAILLCLLSWLCATPARAEESQPLRLERKIPLAHVGGRIDHMAIDLDRKRLIVAELGNDTGRRDSGALPSERRCRGPAADLGQGPAGHRRRLCQHSL